ncbi:MAG: hypothetical protein KME12_16910 [Trichocoleus desertorum ATA4-8-CV12]|jgi:hypothetical protein|nr:hypothetical protein [Trichocoleus desertorum ATA4-8-CV12]
MTNRQLALDIFWLPNSINRDFQNTPQLPLFSEVVIGVLCLISREYQAQHPNAWLIEVASP